MNRISIILLCVTTLAVFYILKQKPKLDIQKYEDKISYLEIEINSLEQANDSLVVKSALLNSKIAEYNTIIDELNTEIDAIHADTKKKLDSIDHYNNDQLQKFFSNRYNSIIKK